MRLAWLVRHPNCDMGGVDGINVFVFVRGCIPAAQDEDFVLSILESMRRVPVTFAGLKVCHWIASVVADMTWSVRGPAKRVVSLTQRSCNTFSTVSSCSHPERGSLFVG